MIVVSEALALQHGLLQRTLMLPVVANKAFYHLPPLIPTLVEERRSLW